MKKTITKISANLEENQENLSKVLKEIYESLEESLKTLPRLLQGPFSSQIITAPSTPFAWPLHQGATKTIQKQFFQKNYKFLAIPALRLRTQAALFLVLNQALKRIHFSFLLERECTPATPAIIVCQGQRVKLFLFFSLQDEMQVKLRGGQKCKSESKLLLNTNLIRLLFWMPFSIFLFPFLNRLRLVGFLLH